MEPSAPPAASSHHQLASIASAGRTDPAEPLTAATTRGGTRTAWVHGGHFEITLRCLSRSHLQLIFNWCRHPNRFKPLGALGWHALFTFILRAGAHKVSLRPSTFLIWQVHTR